MVDAFFVRADDAGGFVATAHTAGLWSPHTQHAGPPSALLVRAMESTPTTIDGPATVARFTVEILGPIPVGPVAVTARLARPGRSVELVEAELSGAGRPIMAARAWRIRTASIELPPGGIEPAAPPRPPDAAVFADPTMHSGYLAAMEWRFVEGTFESDGPSRVWARQRIPLVAGEEPTALQRLVTLADSGNGLSGMFDFASWWFINTDLTLHLVRAPAGEWMYAAARTHLGPDGAGAAHTELFDVTGRVGAGAQALLVGRR